MKLTIYILIIGLLTSSRLSSLSGNRSDITCTSVNNTLYDPQKETIMIQMRDGINLSTDLFIPKNSKEKLPVILMRTPTNKSFIGYTPYYFVARGYVIAVQDVRGRFASEGIWEPFINEAEDGYDNIEWLAKQDWCNGKVGMRKDSSGVHWY